jgi:hypothetical protein
LFQAPPLCNTWVRSVYCSGATRQPIYHTISLAHARTDTSAALCGPLYDKLERRVNPVPLYLEGRSRSQQCRVQGTMTLDMPMSLCLQSRCLDRYMGGMNPRPRCIAWHCIYTKRRHAHVSPSNSLSNVSFPPSRSRTLMQMNKR